MTNFEEIINQKTTTIIKFGASWCGPCKILDKVIEKVKAVHPDTYKIDVEEYPQLGAQFQIRNLPTTIIFRNGESIDRITGLINEKTFLERLEKLQS